jgi:rhodanese-related sulfurtransferase
VSVDHITMKIAAGEAPFFVDLRSLGAREQVAGIPGAIALALDDLEVWPQRLPQDRDVILYCDCPRDASSVEGTRRLRQLGWTRVWALEGGLDAWNAAVASRGTRPVTSHVVPA